MILAVLQSRMMCSFARVNKPHLMTNNLTAIRLKFKKLMTLNLTTTSSPYLLRERRMIQKASQVTCSLYSIPGTHVSVVEQLPFLGLSSRVESLLEYLSQLSHVHLPFQHILILRTAGSELDYATIAYKHYQKSGWVFSQISFLFNYYCGVMLFFQILSQSLYPILLYVMGKEVVPDLSVNWSEFSLSYSCVIIFVMMVLMTMPRDTSYIRKVNAFGVVFIMIFLTFVFSQGVIAISNTD
jgi:hypothetical protein